ncbi:fimbria/pilus periplasmic chaperone [Sphingomonas piscis]|uniref:Fimbria/pilus periplasmic chaperone n=1 Tax=Sphingomonas piscis TaxID=2714943 RepID=A0A6G7YSL5_9SPHN|nr:fimbria/pilus periplasmic chaperone [Sphingomonas piscis]QIK79724.1 fimbria/pilus periplasmic chaperone [Sphingomonas piscis]
MKRLFFSALLSSVLTPSTARAEIVVSQLVVELQPGKVARQDVEIWNNDKDRAYVAIEPHRIVDAGQPTERRVEDPDPEKLGLLVSPARMVLEPGQHKLLRFADIVPPSDRERVYRVTIKPVVGDITANQSGLKVLIGYDALVMVRPAVAIEKVTAERSGPRINWRNEGNVSAELSEGRQCSSAGQGCVDLPGKRLYPGASWSVELKNDGPVEYVVRSPGGISKRKL